MTRGLEEFNSVVCGEAMNTSVYCWRCNSVEDRLSSMLEALGSIPTHTHTECYTLMSLKHMGTKRRGGYEPG